MNGFLSPKGEFYHCNYGEHAELARELTSKNGYQADVFDPNWRDKEGILKKRGYLYFGYTGDLGTNTDSYVFLDNENEVEITKEQIDWVEDNKNELRLKQYGLFCAIVSNDREKCRYFLFTKDCDV